MATRIQTCCFCIHTAEDGTRCGKDVQHWPSRLCRRHFNSHGDNDGRDIIRTLLRCNTHVRNDAPANDNRRGLSHNCSPPSINDDRDEAALLLQQRFQQPIGEDCNPIDSVANVDNVSTEQTLEVNNVYQANQEYEQQRGLTTMTMMRTNTAGAIVAVIPTLYPILKVNCSPWLINGDGDEAALLLSQRFQQPIGDDCNPIHSVANVDDISTGQTFEVNNVGKANGEYEQQRSLTTTRMTTTNTAGIIVAVIPPLVPFFEVNNVSQAQANQGHTLEFNYAGQANQEYEQQRGLMTMMRMTTNTAGGIVAVIPPLLPFLRQQYQPSASESRMSTTYEHNNDNDLCRHCCDNSPHLSSRRHSTRASLGTQQWTK